VSGSASAPLTAAELAQALAAAFNPAAAKEFDGTVRLHLQAEDDAVAEHVLLEVDHGRIETSLPDAPVPADITLYFHTAAEALGLLRGTANPVTAFMDGRFRSDGYLIWVFTVLAMFRPA